MNLDALYSGLTLKPTAKLALVVLDGVGDIATAEQGYLTPLEAAVTPNPGASPVRIDLVQSDGIWERTYTVNDTATRALKVEWEVRDDQNKPIVIADPVAWILMTGPDGRPVRGRDARGHRDPHPPR